MPVLWNKNFSELNLPYNHNGDFIMSDYILNADGMTDIPISKIELRIGLNSGPIITIELADGKDSLIGGLNKKDAFRKATWSNKEASLKMPGTTLTFTIKRIQTINKENTKVIGIVLDKEIDDWLKKNPLTDGTKENILIHQYNPSKTETVELFIESFFDKELLFCGKNENLGYAFEPYSCIWQHTSWKNIEMLNRLVSHISNHVPEIWGWCVVNDKKTPLRIITGDLKLKLNDKWQQGDSSLPHFLIDDFIESNQTTISYLLECDNIGKFFTDISEGCYQNNSSEFSGILSQGGDQLLLVPGPIEYKSKQYLCSSISYVWNKPKEGDKISKHINMSISLKELMPFRYSFSNSLFQIEGLFKKWKDNNNNEYLIEIGPVSHDGKKDWVMINKENGVKSPSINLLSRVITQAPVNNSYKGNTVKHSHNYTGIYFTHKEDDHMICMLEPGKKPNVLGSYQVYNSFFEDADITFNAQKIAISASDKEEELKQAFRIMIDEKEDKSIDLHSSEKINSNTKKILSGATELINNKSKKIEIEAQKIKIEAQSQATLKAITETVVEGGRVKIN